MGHLGAKVLVKGHQKIMENRINVAPQSRYFKANGVPDNSASFFPAHPNPDFDQDSWQQRKPEVYALTGILTDLIVKDAFERRPPTNELVAHSAKTRNPFPTLEQNMEQALTTSVWGVTLRLKHEEGTPEENSVFRRLDYLLDSFKENTGQFITRGVGTANGFMSRLLAVAPKVAHTSNPEELIEIAANSFPLIARVASSQLNVDIPFIEAICLNKVKSGPFDPENFEVRVVNGRKSIELSADATKTMEDIKAKRNDSPVSSQAAPTVGCPAMVNLGEGSAVQVLWNWYMEHARDLYPRFATNLVV